MGIRIRNYDISPVLDYAFLMQFGPRMGPAFFLHQHVLGA